MKNVNKFTWTTCLCILLCIVGYFWFSYTSRKMNISPEFRILYYVIMLPLNLFCIKIFFNGVVRGRSYIMVFIFGALLGTTCGFIAWQTSLLSMEHQREILINTLKRDTLVAYLIVTVPLSAVLTLSFLIGEVTAVLSKYFWGKPKPFKNITGGLQ